VKRLTNHVFGRAEMSRTQVTAALGLLKKSLPDLAAVENKHRGAVNVQTKEQLTPSLPQPFVRTPEDHTVEDLMSPPR